MIISIIASMSENYVIGKNNKLLWKLSSDLKRFKELTINHPIIMGKNTFTSLPNGALPDRMNIVLTNDINFSANNITIAHNIFEALEIAKLQYGKNSEVFIIGGEKIYKQYIEYADKIYLTIVHSLFEGDTYFPELKSDWRIISEEFKEKDIDNEYDHTYKIYKRIKK